jgi:hypothetical protein
MTRSFRDGLFTLYSPRRYLKRRLGHRLWGAPRIHDELLKLGSKSHGRMGCTSNNRGFSLE